MDFDLRTVRWHDRECRVPAALNEEEAAAKVQVAISHLTSKRGAGLGRI